MIIYYNETGRVFNVVPERDSDNADLGIPWINVDEYKSNKYLYAAILQDLMDGSSIFTVVGGVLNKNGVPVVLIEDTDRVALRNEYPNIITQLQAIEDAVNPTNAQVIQAVKFLANTEKKIMKYLKRTLG